MNHLSGQKIYETFSELFNLSVRIRESFERLADESNQVQEIAMNAAITAGHMRSAVKTHGEIAKQLRVTAGRITDKCSAVRRCINSINDGVLRASILCRYLRFYESAYAGVSDKRNARIMEEAIAQKRKEIAALAQESGSEIHDLESGLKAVVKGRFRLHAAHSLLKIETVNVSDEERERVCGLADELYDSTVRSAEKTEEIGNLIKTLKLLFMSLDGLVTNEEVAA